MPDRSTRSSRSIALCCLAATCSLGLFACPANPLTGDDLQNEFQEIVRTRASVDFPCDAASITVTDLDGNAFRSTGCGVYQDYQCEYDDASGNSKNAFLYLCRPVRNHPENTDASAAPDETDGG